MRRLLQLLLLLSNLTVNVKSQPQHWRPLPFKFNWNDARYYIDSSENVMYIGGMFDSVNGVHANLVKWDGDTSITYLNAPVNHIDGLIRFKGKLYVNIQGKEYRWDDSVWTMLSTPFRDWGLIIPCGDRLLVCQSVTDSVTYKDSTVMVSWDGQTQKDSILIDSLWNRIKWGFQCAAWYKGELYLGGTMSHLNRPELEGIMRFDGKSFRDVGGGIPGNGAFGVDVRQLLVWKDDLYICGSFQESVGGPGNGIARWDGSAWHRLDDGLWRQNNMQVQRMAVYNDELYAVGVFDYAGGVPAPGGIARWDGWKWCAINDYFEGRVCSELTAYNGELYTGGGWASINGDTSFNYLARWKGGTFGDTCSVSLSIQNIGSSINSVAIYPNPATDIIHIGVTGSCTVALIDELGKLVYCAPYAPKGIDISRLGKGMYIVKVICREEVRIGKLIKTD